MSTTTVALPDVKRCASCRQLNQHLALACRHCGNPFAAAKSKDPDQGLITAGIAFALLLPIIGFFFGVILLIKNRVGPGLGVIALCPVGLMLGFVLLYGV